MKPRRPPQPETRCPAPEVRLRAAIYARKSNDDNGGNPENKSVARQVERAKAYAKRKGWEVEEEHVYTDDGISGAEYVNRPAFARLIASLPKRGKPPFDVLVMSESSRLGRDMARNTMYVLALVEAGVQVWYYLTDEQEKADSPEQKIMVTLRGYASEVERVKAGQRSRDALERKAAKGYNAGGIVYGYDNVPVFVERLGGEPIKSHTDYRVNAEQADVIRRMFRAYAAGHGHVAIAKAMNGDSRYAAISERYFGGVRPASPRKGTGSWAPSSVRKILYNARYTGKIPFGKHRKAYRAGTKVRVKQPGEHFAAERPELRIVPEDLWGAVQERIGAARKTYLRDTSGKLWGRPGTGVESRYLLTGLGACAGCGRSITKLGGRVGSVGKRAIQHYYGCAYHATRGRTICANGTLAPMAETDALVLGQVRELLTPAAANYVVDAALAQLAERARTRPDTPARLDAEARKLRKELARFVAAIAGGTAPAAVLAEIAQREARLAEIERERAAWAMPVPTELEERRLRREARERLAHFDALLLGDVPVARQILRRLIAGRIEFRPEARGAVRGYALRWSVATGALLGGNIAMASPQGTDLFAAVEIPFGTALREAA